MQSERNKGANEDRHPADENPINGNKSEGFCFDPLCEQQKSFGEERQWKQESRKSAPYKKWSKTIHCLFPYQAWSSKDGSGSRWTFRFIR